MPNILNRETSHRISRNLFEDSQISSIESKAENPKDIDPQNENQMEGRFKRLSENESKEREQGEGHLMADYFVDNPVFDEVVFRRRFHMHKHLFFRIVDAVTANDRYFQQRVDVTGRLSLSSLQKCTTVMRVLAYGASFDAVDEYF
ncbi:hypothetical protein Tco_1212274 [Tanacetum coccineum]